MLPRREFFQAPAWVTDQGSGKYLLLEKIPLHMSLRGKEQP